MKTIIVVFRHVVAENRHGDGLEKGFTLVRVENMAKIKELPNQYLAQDGPKCYGADGGFAWSESREKGLDFIYPGEFITPEKLEKILKTLKESGEILAEVLREEDFESWRKKRDIKVAI